MNLQDKWLIILIIFVVVFGAFGLSGHMLFDNDDEIIVDDVEINEEIQKNEYTEEELYILLEHNIYGKKLVQLAEEFSINSVNMRVKYHRIVKKCKKIWINIFIPFIYFIN